MANPKLILDKILDAKMQRPSVCLVRISTIMIEVVEVVVAIEAKIEVEIGVAIEVAEVTIVVVISKIKRAETPINQEEATKVVTTTLNSSSSLMKITEVAEEAISPDPLVEALTDPEVAKVKKRNSERVHNSICKGMYE